MSLKIFFVSLLLAITFSGTLIPTGTVLAAEGVKEKVEVDESKTEVDIPESGMLFMSEDGE